MSQTNNSEFVAETLEVVMPILQKAIREAFVAGADWALSVNEIDPTLTIARAANEYTIRVTRGE